MRLHATTTTTTKSIFGHYTEIIISNKSRTKKQTNKKNEISLFEVIVHSIIVVNTYGLI